MLKRFERRFERKIQFRFRHGASEYVIAQCQGIRDSVGFGFHTVDSGFKVLSGFQSLSVSLGF